MAFRAVFLRNISNSSNVISSNLLFTSLASLSNIALIGSFYAAVCFAAKNIIHFVLRTDKFTCFPCFPESKILFFPCKFCSIQFFSLKTKKTQQSLFEIPFFSGSQLNFYTYFSLLSYNHTMYCIFYLHYI